MLHSQIRSKFSEECSEGVGLSGNHSSQRLLLAHGCYLFIFNFYFIFFVFPPMSCNELCTVYASPLKSRFPAIKSLEEGRKGKKRKEKKKDFQGLRNNGKYPPLSKPEGIVRLLMYCFSFFLFFFIH